MNSKRSAITAALMGLALLQTACAGDRSLWQTTVAPLELRLPASVLGLRVAPESVTDLVEKRTGANYLDAVALASFREAKLLRATLQVGRFGPQARPASESFRRSVIAVLGAATPRLLKVGDQNVYLTRGNQQTVFAWFSADRFFVLTVHRAYERPRDLLRAILESGVGG